MTVFGIKEERALPLRWDVVLFIGYICKINNYSAITIHQRKKACGEMNGSNHRCGSAQ